RGVGDRFGELRNLDVDAHNALDSGTFGHRGLPLARIGRQGRSDQRLLLAPMQRVDTGSGGRRAGTAGIEQLVPVVQRLLQAVPDLVPGALVLGLLLTPDDLGRIRVARDRARVLLDRKGIELLDAYDRDAVQLVRAPRLGQLVIDLAAA